MLDAMTMLDLISPPQRAMRKLQAAGAVMTHKRDLVKHFAWQQASCQSEGKESGTWIFFVILPIDSQQSLLSSFPFRTSVVNK